MFHSCIGPPSTLIKEEMRERGASTKLGNKNLQQIHIACYYIKVG